MSRRDLVGSFVVVLALSTCSSGARADEPPSPEAATAYAPANVQEPVLSVRDIDWRNHAYRIGEPGDADELVVKRGRVEWAYDGKDHRVAPDYRHADPEKFVEHGFLEIEPPLFGDLNGDGIEDVLLSSDLNEGGNAVKTGLKVYTVENGALKVLGFIHGGHRAHDGIRKVRLDGSTIVVHRWIMSPKDPECCPSRLRTERWSWTGKRFAEDSRVRRVRRVRRPAAS